jgi:hypothetical protein
MVVNLRDFNLRGALMSGPRILLAVWLAALLAASSAHASWLLGANAGVAMPAGTFSDLWGSGFSSGISAGYMLNPRFAAGVDASYSRFGTTSDYQALLNFIDPGASDVFTAWRYGVHGDYMIPVGSESKFSPYVVGGVALYGVKDKYRSPTNADELSQTAFGIRGGIGCDYWVSPTFGIGLGADYNRTFTNEDDIGFGNAPYFSITAGVRWKAGAEK